jgi:glycerol-1-phosphate dehydrogenase [NAD(P)+]
VDLRHAVIDHAALEQVPAYLQARGLQNILLVGDVRTLAATGGRLEDALVGAGLSATVCTIADNARGEVIADEDAVVQTLVALRPETQAVLAVGAGTLHDIVRFACHRAGRAFISVPTAPSVDGFASTGAPLILRGFKQTIPAASPEAIFADLDVLAAAPRPLLAAGFGDMLGKFTSLADWRLGRLLFDEDYCPAAADITRKGLELCLTNVGEIAKATPRGVGLLMEGLLLSGVAMLMVGNSRPASGSEHHLSHFWEMRYLQQGRRAELHGAKVGVACVLMAALYQTLRHASVRDIEAALDAYTHSTREADEARMTRIFGEIAPQVIGENFPEGAASPALSPCTVQERWREVRAIADSVPEPGRLEEWLRAVGGPATPEDLDISDELVEESLANAMYVRNRYSVLRLAAMVGQIGG